MLDFEQLFIGRGFQYIAGVDEVGRGSWAGPLVAAAVILPLNNPGALRILQCVRDSKLLDPRLRRELREKIESVAIGIGLGQVSEGVIDEIGLSEANRRAMLDAVANLFPAPDALLLDFVRLPTCSLPQMAFPRADRHSLSVAAASIVAKVFRDRCMETLAREYPGYGFERHKGYGTPLHRAALQAQGPSPLHRMTVRPVAASGE
jgi:ribonuclease HII